MTDDYLWDPQSRPAAGDADVQRLEALLGRYRHVERGTPRWARASAARRWMLLATLAAAAAVVAWFALGTSEPHWSVHGLAGLDRLRAGEALENASGGDVKVGIGAIGELAVAPGSRLRAEDCGRDRHSLFLERGSVHARIVAPARVFQIDTPAGRTIDLGCEYEVRVEPDGRTRVRVESGQVEFVLDGREVYVPAHASCDALPGRGPGVPVFDDPSNTLRDVLAMATGLKTISAKDPESLFDSFLSECTDEDTLTLWHLYDSDTLGGKVAPGSAAPVEAWMRARIFARLARQFPLPPGVDAEGLARGDRAQRRAWRDSMQPAWRVELRRR